MRLRYAMLRFSVFVMLGFGMAGSAANLTPSDRDKYEKLGLSEAEWAQIVDAKMPMVTVHELLKSGISISEYFRHPWTEMGISQADWIKQRRSGLSDADIRSQARQRRTPNELTVVQSVFLPGFNQIRFGEPVRGWTMAALAAGCIGLFAVQNIRSTRFEPLGLFLLLPDLVWSGIDMGVRVHRERDRQPAQNAPARPAIDITVSFSFH
jgi:hypothetical protein